MNGVIFSRRCDNRTRGIESLADGWKRDYHDAQFAWDVQDLVLECLDQVQFLQRCWEVSVEKAVDGQVCDIDEHGRLLLDIFNRSIRVFDFCLQMIGNAKRIGHTIEGEKVFHRQTIEMKELSDRIRKKWPIRDAAELISLAQTAEPSKSRPLERLIHELECSDSD